MRPLALIALAAFSLASIACDVRLQPSQQGEWSNVHKDKDKVSQDAKPSTEKQAEKQPEAK